jgi:hypothetical protein
MLSGFEKFMFKLLITPREVQRCIMARRKQGSSVSEIVNSLEKAIRERKEMKPEPEPVVDVTYSEVIEDNKDREVEVTEATKDHFRKQAEEVANIMEEISNNRGKPAESTDLATVLDEVGVITEVKSDSFNLVDLYKDMNTANMQDTKVKFMGFKWLFNTASDEEFNVLMGSVKGLKDNAEKLTFMRKFYGDLDIDDCMDETKVDGARRRLTQLARYVENCDGPIVNASCAEELRNILGTLTEIKKNIHRYKELQIKQSLSKAEQNEVMDILEKVQNLYRGILN